MIYTENFEMGSCPASSLSPSVVDVILTGLCSTEAVVVTLFLENTSQSKLFSSATFIIEGLDQQLEYYITKILYQHQQQKYYINNKNENIISTTKMFVVLVDPVEKCIKTRTK